MQPSDLTIEILKGIRDEVRGTNSRLDETNVWLDETNSRLEKLRSDTNARFERMEQRQTESDVRVRTEIAGVVGAVDRLRDVLLEDRALRRQVDDHEKRIVAIERRAG